MQRPVRRQIAQNERNRIVLVDGELADGGHIFAAQMHRRTQDHHVRPGDGAQRAVFEPRHPGHDGAIAEAQNQLGAHRQLAARADQKTHDGRMLPAHRHEIDQGGCAVIGLEMGFEHQSVRPIPAGDAGFPARRNRPSPVFAGAEQRRKAGLRIEPRAAEPVDRAIAGDQRRGTAIADDRIVFDAGGHCAQENSTMTLMSSGCRSSDCVHCSTGSRRVIRLVSQAWSARANASPAIS